MSTRHAVLSSLPLAKEGIKVLAEMIIPHKLLATLNPWPRSALKRHTLIHQHKQFRNMEKGLKSMKSRSSSFQPSQSQLSGFQMTVEVRFNCSFIVVRKNRLSPVR